MEPVFALLVAIMRPILVIGFRWRIRGLENIPRSGPAIFACNHISLFDPLAVGYTLVQRRRPLRFLAKAELWRSPVPRFLLRRIKAIPVERGTGAEGPVDHALSALHRGDPVVIFPEARITTSDDLSPMTGKTGVARIALTGGYPVVPVAVWGSHWVLPQGRVNGKRLRRLIAVTVGSPQLFTGDPDDEATLRSVTDQIMQRLTVMVRDIQKEYPGGAAVPPRKAVQTQKGMPA